MDGRGEQFLAGPRFAADEHGRVGGRDLVDAQIDFAHGVRVADDILRPKALLQVAAEPQVLGLEGLLPGGFHPPRVDVEGDHAGHDFQQPRLLAQRLRPLDRQIDGERADDLALQDDGHAEEADVVDLGDGALVDAVGEAGLLRDARHQRRLPRLQDGAENALAATIAQLRGAAGWRGFGRPRRSTRCRRASSSMTVPRTMPRLRSSSSRTAESSSRCPLRLASKRLIDPRTVNSWACRSVETGWLARASNRTLRVISLSTDCRTWNGRIFAHCAVNRQRVPLFWARNGVNPAGEPRAFSDMQKPGRTAQPAKTRLDRRDAGYDPAIAGKDGRSCILA